MNSRAESHVKGRGEYRAEYCGKYCGKCSGEYAGNIVEHRGNIIVNIV